MKLRLLSLMCTLSVSSNFLTAMQPTPLSKKTASSGGIKQLATDIFALVEEAKKCKDIQQLLGTTCFRAEASNANPLTELAGILNELYLGLEQSRLGPARVRFKDLSTVLASWRALALSWYTTYSQEQDKPRNFAVDNLLEILVVENIIHVYTVTTARMKRPCTA